MFTDAQHANILTTISHHCYKFVTHFAPRVQ